MRGQLYLLCVRKKLLQWQDMGDLDRAPAACVQSSQLFYKLVVLAASNISTVCLRNSQSQKLKTYISSFGLLVLYSRANVFQECRSSHTSVSTVRYTKLLSDDRFVGGYECPPSFPPTIE